MSILEVEAKKGSQEQIEDPNNIHKILKRLGLQLFIKTWIMLPKYTNTTQNLKKSLMDFSQDWPKPS